MTHQEIIDYCMKKKGAYLDYPFDQQMPVIKVNSDSQQKGRIFAQVFFLKGQPKVTLNCTPVMGEFYRSIYPDTVVRGYHCPAVQQPHFNTISLDSVISDEELYHMMDQSYDTVIAKYPAYIQRQILSQ
ncbi:MAG: MmcQ/YjbR family DNA-binding protein [Oscillospiraceae bacterium]|nr:MmcQ/YjbR family DNA-binding protein [Oscillospiraceae bacterium]